MFLYYKFTYSRGYFDGNEIEKKIQEALLKLPTKQRIAFNMKYFEKMKYDEISEILRNFWF